MQKITKKFEENAKFCLTSCFPCCIIIDIEEVRSIYSVLFEARKGTVLAVLNPEDSHYKSDFDLFKECALEWCRDNNGDLHTVFLSTPYLTLIKRLTSDKFVPFRFRNFEEIFEAKTLKSFIICKLNINFGLLQEELHNAQHDQDV